MVTLYLDVLYEFSRLRSDTVYDFLVSGLEKKKSVTRSGGI